ncbi:MAG: acyl-CoA dehydrogenase family protein [Porticoccaceae bacterium]
MNSQREIFSEEHNLYRETVRRFFKQEVEPHLKQWEKDGRYPRDLFTKAGTFGLLCAGIPEEYGGGGGDILHHIILHEEMGYSIAGAYLDGGLGTDISSYLIYRAGTEEQKRYWLPKYATGEVIAEAAITEAGGGSDVAAIKTTAVRDGDDYVVNGSKLYITNGNYCDMILTVCRTGDAITGNNFSIFLIPTNVVGVSRGKNLETMARGCGDLAEFFFDDARVPAENLLGGEEGRGFAKAMSIVSEGRVAESARFLAAAELGFEITLDYVKNRKAFGNRIIDFQNTQFKLAEMKAQMAVARAYMDCCLGKLVKGTIDPVEASIAKLWMSELEGRVMDECVQLHGGAGFMNEYPISKLYTSARVHRILLGTSEIQKITISRSLF